jgi:hypothetical protein
VIKTALWELQKAVFNRLNNDPTLRGMVTGVFDQVAEGTPLPYVQIGDDTVNPYDTKTDNGEDSTLTLHVWSGGPGKTEAKKIMDAVLMSMTNGPLTLDGFNLEGIRREFIEIMNDGIVFHGICRFRMYIKQI